jgi:hypothetical protein
VQTREVSPFCELRREVYTFSCTAPATVTGPAVDVTVN